MFRVDDYMPAEIKFYEFFRLNGWTTPVSSTNNPYTFAHQTGGKSMWEYMAQFPERLKNFNYAMVAQNNATFWTVSLFPFYEELSKYEKLRTKRLSLWTLVAARATSHARSASYVRISRAE